MKVIIFFVLDIIEYAIQGSMFAWFLHGMVKERNGWNRLIGESRISYAQAAVVIPFIIVQMLLHGIPPIQRFLYGEYMMPSSSVVTILHVMITMLMSFVVCMLVYERQKGKLFCYITVFYSMMELIRFAIYPVFSIAIELGMQRIIRLVEQNIWVDNDSFMVFLTVVEILWGLLFNAVLVLILYFCIREYKKMLVKRARELGRIELLFLMAPCVTGMLFCALIRVIFYNFNDNGVEIIFDKHMELHIIVPLVSFLSLFSILFSAKAFRRMAEEGEEKLNLQIYKERMRSMETHMKDIEQLYESIRGIKHDMRHYIADMQMLLKTADPTREMLVQFEDYMKELQHAVQVYDMQYRTGNPVTDMIVHRYESMAAEKETAFESDFIFPRKFSISVFDLSIILNNALENAMEACERMPEGMLRYIVLHSFCRENMFFLEIRNSFCGPLLYQRREQRLQTTKEDKEMHGFGLKNIESCAEKYHGRAEYSVKHDVGHSTMYNAEHFTLCSEFKLCVMLQR